MTAAIERRLAELERLVAEADRYEAEPRRDPATMTDAEAVEAYRRLLARSTPRTKPFEPSPEDAAEWRRLYERERRLG